MNIMAGGGVDAALNYKFPDHFEGVKALVQSGIDGQSVPHMYIRPENQRPSPCTSVTWANDMPLIDLAELNGEGRAATLEAISRACETWGVFWVKNHGNSLSTMERLMKVIEEFFNLPTEEKMKHFTTDLGSFKRYGTSFNPAKDDIRSWRDFLRLECVPLEDMMKRWPESPSAFRKTAAEYVREQEELQRKLRGAVVESLGMPNDYIEKTYGTASMVLICNCYPACPIPQLTLGLTSHSDPGWISVVMQGQVGGLQILHDDHWISVPPRPDALIVLVADQTQILSNGRYKSVEHRVVVNRNRERLSVVTGSEPSLDKTVSPPLHLLHDDKSLYKPRPYGEYRLSLLESGLNGKSGLRSISADSN